MFKQPVTAQGIRQLLSTVLDAMQEQHEQRQEAKKLAEINRKFDQAEQDHQNLRPRIIRKIQIQGNQPCQAK